MTGFCIQKRKNKGQSLVEYVALTALVAIVSIGTVKLFGGKVRTRLNQITNVFDRNIQQGLRSKVDTSGTDDTSEENTPTTGRNRTSGFKLPRLF